MQRGTQIFVLLGARNLVENLVEVDFSSRDPR